MAPADITALPLFLRVDIVATAWKPVYDVGLDSILVEPLQV